MSKYKFEPNFESERSKLIVFASEDMKRVRNMGNLCVVCRNGNPGYAEYNEKECLCCTGGSKFAWRGERVNK